MKPRKLADILIDDIEYNRARIKNEVAQGICDLMRAHGVTRTKLAGLLGVEKSRVSHMLSGHQNFRLDTIADVYLALGRILHFTMGRDLYAYRFPLDEPATSTIAGESGARVEWAAKGATDHGFVTKVEQATRQTGWIVRSCRTRTSGSGSGRTAPRPALRLGGSPSVFYPQGDTNRRSVILPLIARPERPLRVGSADDFIRSGKGNDRFDVSVAGVLSGSSAGTT